MAVAAEGQRPVLLLLCPDGGVVVQAEGQVVLQGRGQYSMWSTGSRAFGAQANGEGALKLGALRQVHKGVGVH